MCYLFEHTRKNEHEIVTNGVTVCISPHLIYIISYSVLTEGHILATNSLQRHIYLKVKSDI